MTPGHETDDDRTPRRDARPRPGWRGRVILCTVLSLALAATLTQQRTSAAAPAGSAPPSGLLTGALPTISAMTVALPPPTPLPARSSAPLAPPRGPRPGLAAVRARGRPAPPAARRSCVAAGPSPSCPVQALLPGTLLIADRGNNRLIEVNAAKRIVWAFPRPGDLRPGQVFLGPDDAFFTPDGRAIITNQEGAQTLGRIAYRTHRLVWQYGHVGVRGSAPGYLNEPDDAYQLRNGLVSVADIRNCRILFLSPVGAVVRQYGRTGICVHAPPSTFALPNGDTPLLDGGTLVTEIGGSHVVRLNAAGRVLFDLALPWVSYPSDAQLLADGSLLLADFSRPGGILRVSTRGRLLWRYAPPRASDRLNHPSLALMLPNGLIAATDDWNHRVVLINPHRQSIVWQYGVTGVQGSAPGYLNTPDGIDLRPAGG